MLVMLLHLKAPGAFEDDAAICSIDNTDDTVPKCV